MYDYEKYYKQYKLIAGIDEVGRGALAGPVVSACVILPLGCTLPVNDSKKLSPKKRKLLFDEIKKIAIATEVGIVDNDIIDKINILQATKLSMEISLKNISLKPNLLLIDALAINTKIPQKAIVNGDGLVAPIAAASIIAKVTRDEIMVNMHNYYPQYGFDKHKGYGTKLHIQSIKDNGMCKIHRYTFKNSSHKVR